MSEQERKDFEAKLERYWSLAYQEGKTGESRGSEANEVLAQLRAALAQQAVPEGWKLVPVEPTPEMVHAIRFAGDPDRPAIGERIVAGETAYPFVGEHVALRMYRTALAAAPAAPLSSQGAAVGAERPNNPQDKPPAWTGAVAFIQHVQNAAGATGHWSDEFLAWYKPDEWFGEHRAAAVFVGQKVAALAAQQAEREPNHVQFHKDMVRAGYSAPTLIRPGVWSNDRHRFRYEGWLAAHGIEKKGGA